MLLFQKSLEPIKKKSISAIGGSTSAVVLVHIAPIKQLVSLDLKMAS